MTGITGLRLLHMGTKSSVVAPMGPIGVTFPHKTTVSSQQMVDNQGRPTYRKDIHV
jgi:hypothetical protein